MTIKHAFEKNEKIWGEMVRQKKFNLYSPTVREGVLAK